ncbi:MAG TPA: CAP domain-containing protein [Usitatibacter sp.]|nr:CAP domain-containing protein [Usitatibacter sp.]
MRFALALVVVAAWAVSPAWAEEVLHADVATAAGRVMAATNELRRGEGLPALKPQRQLEQAAQEFARYMAKTARYGHEADGREPAQRAEAQGYAYCVVLENIAYHYDSRGFTTAALAQHVVDGWKHSEGHRRNMLDARATETGVAIAQGERNGYYYAVQMFGLPRSASVAFAVRNESPAAVSYRVGTQRFTLPPGSVRTHETCSGEKLAFDNAALEGSPRQPRRNDEFVVPASGGPVTVRRK